MSRTFSLPSKDIKRNIETFFSSIHRRIQDKFNPAFESDRLYMEAFRTHTMLQEFGLLTDVTNDYFNKITIIKIGTSVEEIHRLTYQFAQNNAAKTYDKPVDKELTEEEMAMVTHWYQFLFSKREKNLTPFILDV